MSIPEKTTQIINDNFVIEFLSKYDNFLLDCDGVLWLGSTVIKGIPETLDMLKKLGKNIVFVTNNSTQSRQDYQKKLSGFGITSEISQIYNSGYAAARYLIKHNFNKKAYIIGEGGLGREFDANGISWRGISEHATMPKDMHQVVDEVKKLDHDIGAVVVGMDKYMTYTKIAFALHHLNTIPNCQFIATNTDETLPCDVDLLLPGSGTIVKMLETCYGKPPIVCGKPEQQLLDLIVEEHSMDRSRTIMVGDKLTTDILWGCLGNISTLLVFTGVTSKEEFEQERKIIPSFAVDSLVHLLNKV